MKALPTLALLAAFFAFLVLPLDFEIAGSALFAAGFAAIVVTDYSRRLRPLPVVVGSTRRERFGLAA
jgi:hypothetical protein